jgi:hypothetical protein
MSRSSLRFIGCLLFATSTSALPLSAQNLLTNNAGFEASTGYYTPAWGFPQGSPDVLPGWVITLESTGDGYSGAAADQSPPDLEGTHFGYIYSGTGIPGILETAPGSRAPVEKDRTYTLWFLARGDTSWSEASAAVSLIWYPNQNDTAGVGPPTNLSLTLPAHLSTNDPMLTFHLTAVAPPGAHYAGVRISRPPYDYTSLLLDDFVIMAEPTAVSLAIEPQGPNARVSWVRTRKYRLETSHSLTFSNGWNALDRPVKSVGPMNHVDYPFTETVHFFRLTLSDQ